MSKKAIDFINKYRIYFGLAERVFSIPAVVLLAMSANETGWGCSNNFKKTNNLYGLKTKTIYDNGIILISPEYNNKKKYHQNSKFRKYENPIESIYDTSLRISNNSIYAIAYKYFVKYSITHKKKYLNLGIDEIAINWATDPNYANKIKNIINRKYVKEFFKW